MFVIGLMWHDYPSENLGVGALTHGHFQILDETIQKIGIDAEYLVVSNVNESDNCFNQVTTRPVRYIKLSLKDIIKKPSEYITIKEAISSCNIVIDLSAGDSFTDIYGLKRFVQQVFTKFLAISTDRPLILCPQTIGPFDKWYGRFFSKFIIKRSQHIFARDDISFNYLSIYKTRKNTDLAADLAFVLPFNRNFFEFDRSHTHIGLNVSGLLFNGGYNNNNQFNLKIDYQVFIRNLIKRLLILNNVRVHLISHVISEYYEVDDDYRVCLLLSKEFPECVLAPRFMTPTDAKSYISGLDFFSGARMHSTIAAYSSGVPVVPFSYSRKFSGLFGSLGYKYLVEGKQNNNEEAINIIFSAFENRKQLLEDIVNGNKLAKERLEKYRNYLHEIIKEYSNG